MSTPSCEIIPSAGETRTQRSSCGLPHATVTPAGRTWKPANGVVFANERRVTTWQPSDGIIFASTGAPSSITHQDMIVRSQSRHFSATTQKTRIGRLPTTQPFDPSKVRKAELPPVEVPADEYAEEKDDLDDIEEVSLAPFEKVKLPENQFKPSIRNYTRSEPEYQGPQGTSWWRSALNALGIARRPLIEPGKVQLTPPRLRRRQKTRSPKREPQLIEASHVDVSVDPESMRGSSDDTMTTQLEDVDWEVFNRLTSDNFMLPKEVICHQQLDLPCDRSRVSDPVRLSTSLSLKQRYILWAIRTTHDHNLQMKDIFDLRDMFWSESLAEGDQMKRIQSRMLQAAIATTYLLAELLALSRDSEDPEMRVRAEKIYAVARWKHANFISDFPSLAHQVRYLYRCRGNLFFEYWMEELGSRSPEIYRSKALNAYNSKLRALSWVRYRISQDHHTLIHRETEDMLWLPGDPAFAQFEDKLKWMQKGVTLAAARMDSIMLDMKRMEKPPILDEPSYLSLREHLTPYVESLIRLMRGIRAYDRRHWELIDRVSDMVRVLARNEDQTKATAIYVETNECVSALKQNIHEVHRELRSLSDWASLPSGVSLVHLENALESLEGVRKWRALGTPSDFKLTSKTPKTWSHNLYRNSHDEMVTTHYCADFGHARDVLSLFKHCSVVGLDLEWLPYACSTDGPFSHVSMIQIASEDQVALLHLAQMDRLKELGKIGSSLANTFTRDLREILENPSITKAGVNIKNDCTRLEKHLGIYVQGAVELSHIHKQLQYHTGLLAKADRKAVRLADLVRHYFGMEIPKDNRIRLRDWTQPLEDPKAIFYAAADPYATFQLYHEMTLRHSALLPRPELPAAVDQDLPISCLNNGKSGFYDSASAKKNISAIQSLISKEDVDARRLHIPGDIGPIRGFEYQKSWLLATRLAKIMPQNGWPVPLKTLTMHVAWHVFGIPPLFIGLYARLSEAEVEDILLQIISQKGLPFRSHSLGKIVLHLPTGRAPLSTAEVLRLRDSEIPKAKAFIRKHLPSLKHSLQAQNALLPWALWRTSRRSLAEVFLIGLYKFQPTLLSIQEGISKTRDLKDPTLLTPLEEKLHPHLGQILAMGIDKIGPGNPLFEMTFDMSPDIVDRLDARSSWSLPPTEYLDEEDGEGSSLSTDPASAPVGVIQEGLDLLDPRVSDYSSDVTEDLERMDYEEGY